MKRTLSLIVLLCITASLIAGERETIWPKGKMPHRQDHQIAAMTDETSKKDFDADNIIAGVGDVAGHAAIITHEAVNKPITVWTGSGWSQGGVGDPQSWERKVEEFAMSTASPLKVEIR